MPESVEVKITTESLHKNLAGKTLESIEFYPNSKFSIYNDRYQSLQNFQYQLPLKLDEVNCKGKTIYFKFGTRYLVNGLGMTGVWSFNKPLSHPAVEFKFNGITAIFNDTRRFGNISRTDNINEVLNKLGPDMLSDPPSKEQFLKIVRKYPKWNICKFLMDQSKIAGVGNYIKSEALHRARIDPNHINDEIEDDKVEILRIEIINVMRESYVAGGLSLKDYKSPEGILGNYSDQLQVYGKKSWNGFNIERIETPDNRATWWCPAHVKNKS